MRVLAVVLVGQVGLLAGCGVTLKAANPEQFQLNSDMKTTLDQVFSTDSTFAPRPQDWIGRVGIVRKITNKDTNNQQCSSKATVEWVVDRIGIDPSKDLNDQDTTKRLTYKSVVDQKFAAKVDAIKIVTGDVDANTVYKVLMTEVAKQRVNPNGGWKDAVPKFQTDKKAVYFVPDDICYVVAVAGYSYRILTREKFLKMSSKTAVSYAGVNVNGDYYNTTEDFALDDVFGLSLEILRRPPHEGSGADSGIAKTEKDRQPTPSDADFVGAVIAASVKRTPTKWVHSDPSSP